MYVLYIVYKRNKRFYCHSNEKQKQKKALFSKLFIINYRKLIKDATFINIDHK